MFILMVVIFVLGYAAIALEHPIKIDKAASALLIGVLTWFVFVLNGHGILGLGFSPNWNDLLASSPGAEHDAFHFIHGELEHHLIEIASILFFLLGAMTIVEIVDRHGGFKIITDKIKTLNKVKLLWIFSVLTFFMSAALDNLTTTIVMLALIRKVIEEKEDKWFYASMVVLASNAGGAWSPIGDVTTIMLWIGSQITAQRIIIDTIIPAFVTMVVPVIIMSFFLKGEVKPAKIKNDDEDGGESISDGQRNFIFALGVGSLLLVPVIKTVTHLPPYMGMLFGLGNMWLATEIILKKKSGAFKKKYNVIGILKHVDVATIFFFLGILTAVAALQSAGHLDIVAGWLDTSLGNIYTIDLAIGVLSSIVDNVPLVAGSMGMYSIMPDVITMLNAESLVALQGLNYAELQTVTVSLHESLTPESVDMIKALSADQFSSIQTIAPDRLVYNMEFVQDGNFWKFLAFTAGTGGSILIIGSAAGVAAMGIEKIDFIWYVKKISLLAFVGYLAGAATYWLMFGM